MRSGFDRRRSQWGDTSLGCKATKRLVEDITAYRVVDRIDPQPIGQFEDCRAKAVLPVVDRKVGASISCGFKLVVRACGRDNRRAENFSNFDRCEPNAAGAAVNQ